MANSGKWHIPEQVVCELGQADRMLAGGGTSRDVLGAIAGEPGMLAGGGEVVGVCCELGVSEQAYYRWRNQYGGFKADDAKRVKELERQNAMLKRLLAETELEKAVLKELAEGDF